MKLWHPNNSILSGGPKTFMKYFDEYFENNLVNDYKDADIVFGLNNWVSMDIINDVKSRGIKYVHRSNGVYKPELLKFPDWCERNEKIKPQYFAADHVIFQSVYSMQSYFKFIGEVQNYSVVYNGVDMYKFNDKLLNKGEKIFLLGKSNTQHEIDLRNLIKSNFVNVFDVDKFEGVDEFSRVFDGVGVVVDCDVQSSCNNLDLELMACSVPVLCFPFGGSCELVSRDCIVTRSNIIFKINDVFSNYSDYCDRVLNNVRFNFDVVGCLNSYEDVFCKLT